MNGTQRQMQNRCSPINSYFFDLITAAPSHGKLNDKMLRSKARHAVDPG